MHRRVLAFDFDGTLAENGIVAPELQQTLERLQMCGYALFLVTGRQFESVELGLLREMFVGIVWENGAVLHHTTTGEVYLPFGQVNPDLVEALTAAGVPLERGRAIVSTWEPHGETVWRIVQEWGGDAVVVNNKGAVMILPAGAAKGSGLERLLWICGFSPRNLVSFGDGENDLSLLALGELGVTVADAVLPLKALADIVSAQPGPAGILEVLKTYWLRDKRPNVFGRREREIPLGVNEANLPLTIPGSVLAGSNLGVFGNSGSGKSWVTGLLAEGMHHAGYQTLLIDPEGDFRGLRIIPGIVAVEGNHKTLPSTAFVIALLETVSTSIVLDLCSYPVDLRESYIADLLSSLHVLRERKFRPHWIVLEEAQYFLSSNDSAVLAALLPMLGGGGWTFVSYRPDWLVKPVLNALNQCLVTPLSESKAVHTIKALDETLSEDVMLGMTRGQVWLRGQGLVRLVSSARRVPHVRHLYKYIDSPLPEHKRFRFRDDAGFLGIEAASLFDFLRLLPTLPIESLMYHNPRGDFAAWAENVLGMTNLALHLSKLAHRPLEGEALRDALSQRVAVHYAEVQALR